MYTYVTCIYMYRVHVYLSVFGGGRRTRSKSCAGNISRKRHANLRVSTVAVVPNLVFFGNRPDPKTRRPSPFSAAVAAENTFFASLGAWKTKTRAKWLITNRRITFFDDSNGRAHDLYVNNTELCQVGNCCAYIYKTNLRFLRARARARVCKPGERARQVPCAVTFSGPPASAAPPQDQ